MCLSCPLDVVYSVTYSKFATGVVSTDLDFTVKSFFLTPSMLGRGHIVMEAGGPVWVNMSYQLFRLEHAVLT